LRDRSPDPDPLQLVFQATDAASKQPHRVFHPGDKLYPEARTGSGRKVYLEVFWRPSQGNMLQVYDQRSGQEAVHILKFRDDQGRLVPYELGDQLGEEVLTAFACEERFPPGEVLRGPH